jgi:transcriptional regulator with XRE-family HTH domain
MLTAFGQRVRILRIAQGWSGERLAQESSLTISTVSRTERGEREPLLSTVMLLMGALAVTPADFLADIPVPPKKRSWSPQGAR